MRDEFPGNIVSARLGMAGEFTSDEVSVIKMLDQTRRNAIETNKTKSTHHAFGAETYPPTFADKYALVSAEIARLEGRDADALRLYEQAIHLAREHGFVQNEGLAPRLRVSSPIHWERSKNFKRSSRIVV